MSARPRLSRQSPARPEIAADSAPPRPGPPHPARRNYGKPAGGSQGEFRGAACVGVVTPRSPKRRWSCPALVGGSLPPTGCGEGAGAGWRGWLSVAGLCAARGPAPRADQKPSGADPLSDHDF